MTKIDQKIKVPLSKPPFILSELKKAIPPHCFQRSLVRSFSYVVRDITLVFVLGYIAANYIYVLPSPYNYLAWPIYWFALGSVFTAIWVIAHECGHHGFSNYQWIDDTVGFIFYTSICVPYFSWKYSHRRHHSNGGSLEYDEVYVPRLKSELRRPYDRFASHYNPYSPMYNDRERLLIYFSDLGLIAFIYMWYRIAMVKGLAWVICMYVAPLQMMNILVVVLTFLNHTHALVPHYDSSEWDWLRGALATIDRDFGILNNVCHNVTNTHVLHHLFTTIPHYHAVEATKAIKPILGEYYNFDSTPVYKAIWKNVNECIYVEKNEETQDRGVFWYKNKL
ncbi:hypothetical protein MTR67_017449 [Solanum verrucosum]|uniref:Uncharacterized protein n=1 Tax=Solanum verrucosum TaxID=315347 RepID=A0AAF0QQA7_SOLVR|nr:hypothetical protein MTR67_017449 [Solanum verrucosum]